jgi:predicted NBD/HSP70 family sugar kinase
VSGQGSVGRRTNVPGTTQGLRRANRARLLRALHRLGGAATRPDLVEAGGLSPATVSILVSELLVAGVLAAGPRRASGGGRPPAEVALNPAFGVLVGIDVAETYVHARSFDLALRPVAEWRSADGPGPDAEALIATCARVVRELRALPGTGPDARLLGVGVSVPGLVDPAVGSVLASPGRRTFVVPLGPRLATELGLPVVHVDNPLRASVLAELWLGAGREVDDLAVLTLGTGVGAGLAVAGAVRRGAHQLAGEWGHVPVPAGDRPCPCGRCGCLEAYIGAPGIVRTMVEAGAGPHLLHDGDQVRALSALAAAHDAGDPVAGRVLAEVAGHLADGLVVLAHVVDPAVVVASGWVAEVLGERLLAPAERLARERLLLPAGPEWVVPSSLGDGQVTSGAAALALEGVMERMTLG